MKVFDSKASISQFVIAIQEGLVAVAESAGAAFNSGVTGGV